MTSLLAALVLGLAANASAQSAYEIQVYPSETAAPGATFVEVHSNTSTKGPDAASAAGVQPDLGAYHETLEVTRGFSDWFETGFYLFSSARSGEGWRWAGDHVRPRARVPRSWGWPVGVSLSGEVGYFRPRFQESRWDLELRPIVDWRGGRWYLSVNPAFERILRAHSADATTSLTFAPGVKASYDAFKKAAVGLEYYGETGPIQRVLPLEQQQHQLFAVVDVDFGSAWEFNAGAGFGLTPATDRLVLKLILGRRFGPAKKG